MKTHRIPKLMVSMLGGVYHYGEIPILSRLSADSSMLVIGIHLEAKLFSVPVRVILSRMLLIQLQTQLAEKNDESTMIHVISASLLRFSY
ncbi:hypothetical protein NPIL_396731 [Nephila pilipes]|uniref:Uncharacterized protein n=1 Tax=Nephila pilipes TaxID=299642 RepID=A0A8X6R7C2_NEPPI|nr:hypothetical protein NPIL_396731 [Nephila pilipes]